MNQRAASRLADAKKMKFVARGQQHIVGSDRMFDTLFHADWSCEPAKRWAVTAQRTNRGWTVPLRKKSPAAKLSAKSIEHGRKAGEACLGLIFQ